MKIQHVVPVSGHLSFFSQVAQGCLKFWKVGLNSLLKSVL